MVARVHIYVQIFADRFVYTRGKNEVCIYYLVETVFFIFYFFHIDRVSIHCILFYFRVT